MKGAAAKDVKRFWCREWERSWYLIRDIGWGLSSHGKIQCNGVIAHFSKLASSTSCEAGPNED